MSQDRKAFYRFGEFEIDPARRSVLRSGAVVAVPQKAFQLLLYLLDNPGRVLTKSELMEAVWPQSFVEEGNLAQGIFLLRKALNEQPGQNRYIVTVPGEGYQFAIVPEVVYESPAAPPPQMGRKTPRLDPEPAPSPGDPVEPRAPLVLVPANSGPGNGPANPQANSGSASRARGASQTAFALEPAVADAEQEQSGAQEQPGAQEQSGAQERPAVQEPPDSPAGKTQIQSRVKSRIQSQIQSIPSSAESARPPWRIPLMVAVLAALAGGSALLYRQFFPSRPTPFREYRLRRLTDNQNVQLTAISPDGKYLATVVQDSEGRDGLWVLHLPSGSRRQLLEDKTIHYRNILFSPDSNYIYFRSTAQEYPSADRVMRGEVSRVPVIGGDPSHILDDVDSAPTFLGSGAGSGDRLCFFRRADGSDTYEFVSAGVDGVDVGEGDGEKTLARLTTGIPILASCSPDGKRAAVILHSSGIDIFDFATGQMKPFFHPTGDLWYIHSVTWLPDGRGLVASTASKGGFNLQLGYLAYPGGQYSSITNNLDNYLYGVSFSADGGKLATAEGRDDSRFYLLPLAHPERMREVPFGWIAQFSWLDNGRLIGSGAENALRIADLKSNTDRPANMPQGLTLSAPSPCGEGAIVAVHTQPGPSRTIVRLGLDGGHPTQLTLGGHESRPECTPDGKWLLYSDTSIREKPRVMRVPLAGGEAASAGGGASFDLSPDGKLLAYIEASDARLLSIVSTASWQTVRKIRLPQPVQLSIAFAADGKSVLFSGGAGTAATIYSQPVAGSPARQIASLPGKLVMALRPSPDGTQLAFVAYAPQADAVILEDKRQ